jgi:hypothetical protein
MPVMHECPHHVVRVFRELISKGKDAWNNNKEIKRSVQNEVNHENNSNTTHLSAMMNLIKRLQNGVGGSREGVHTQGDKGYLDGELTYRKTRPQAHNIH